jgi:hypothetical protein
VTSKEVETQTERIEAYRKLDAARMDRPEPESGEGTRVDSAKLEFCAWSEDGCHYMTECKHAFEFTHIDGIETDFKFCPYCGRKIDQV